MRVWSGCCCQSSLCALEQELCCFCRPLQGAAVKMLFPIWSLARHYLLLSRVYAGVIFLGVFLLAFQLPRFSAFCFSAFPCFLASLFFCCFCFSASLLFFFLLFWFLLYIYIYVCVCVVCNVCMYVCMYVMLCNVMYSNVM